MNSTFYILLLSKGSWDDYRRINMGIFESKEDAEEMGKTILKSVEEDFQKILNECPIDESLRIRYEEKYEFDCLDKLPIELQNQYFDWDFNKRELVEIGKNYFVEEIQLNSFDTKEYLKILKEG